MNITPSAFINFELARQHHQAAAAAAAMRNYQVQQQLQQQQQQQQQHHGIHPRLDTSTGSTCSDSTPDQTPMSKTNQYKKIMKPLLERKRRARINKCLDQLKDIMTVALQSQGENVSKLEKADILELTVRHLHKMESAKKIASRNPLEEIQRFQAGYSSCAQEAASFLMSSPGVEPTVGQRLLSHLSNAAAAATTTTTSGRSTPPLPLSPPIPGPLSSPPSIGANPMSPLATSSPQGNDLTHPINIKTEFNVSVAINKIHPSESDDDESVDLSKVKREIHPEDNDSSIGSPNSSSNADINPNDPVWRPF